MRRWHRKHTHPPPLSRPFEVVEARRGRRVFFFLSSFLVNVGGEVFFSRVARRQSKQRQAQCKQVQVHTRLLPPRRSVTMSRAPVLAAVAAPGGGTQPPQAPSRPEHSHVDLLRGRAVGSLAHSIPRTSRRDRSHQGAPPSATQTRPDANGEGPVRV